MIGLMGSLHCIGMCGPIALALPLDRSSLAAQLSGTFIYNSGRLLTYSVIGIILGILGKGVAFFGYQQIFSIIMGAAIILGAVLPYSFDRLVSLTPFMSKFLTRIKTNMGLHLKSKSMTSLLLIGVLNGLLPCGLVYFAVIGAITSYDTLSGGLFMFVFGLGTLPMMITAALSPGFIGIQWRNRVRRILPFFAILIGTLFILRGLNLGIPYVSPQLNPETDTAVECHD